MHVSFYTGTQTHNLINLHVPIITDNKWLLGSAVFSLGFNDNHIFLYIYMQMFLTIITSGVWGQSEECVSVPGHL